MLVNYTHPYFNRLLLKDNVLFGFLVRFTREGLKFRDFYNGLTIL